MRERVTKRKLPFTVGANGEQKDSDTGTRLDLTLYPWRSLAVAIAPVCALQPRARDRPLDDGSLDTKLARLHMPWVYFSEVHTEHTATRAHGLVAEPKSEADGVVLLRVARSKSAEQKYTCTCIGVRVSTLHVYILSLILSWVAQGEPWSLILLACLSSVFDDPCSQTGLHSTGHFLPQWSSLPLFFFFKGLWGLWQRRSGVNQLRALGFNSGITDPGVHTEAVSWA